MNYMLKNLLPLVLQNPDRFKRKLKDGRKKFCWARIAITPIKVQRFGKEVEQDIPPHTAKELAGMLQALEERGELQTYNKIKRNRACTRRVIV